MQLQILFILFTLSVCTIVAQHAENPNLKKETVLADKRIIDDTPSPEWIKYQQERFQNLDQLSLKHRNVHKSSHPFSTNPSFNNEKSIKWQTTSRQDGVENNPHKVKETVKTFEDKTSSAVEFPSVKGFIEFLKSIKQTWMKSSLFRIEDKIKMLHQLKDSLLKTIENQFKILWQDEDDDADQSENAEGTVANKFSQRNYGSHLRKKRGILDESSINFPPDAALISINFLTFAVFLIKLVLQVVNIVKTKHYKFSTLDVDTGEIRYG